MPQRLRRPPRRSVASGRTAGRSPQVRETHIVHHQPVGKPARAFDLGRVNLLRLDIRPVGRRGRVAAGFSAAGAISGTLPHRF